MIPASRQPPRRTTTPPLQPHDTNPLHQATPPLRALLPSLPPCPPRHPRSPDGYTVSKGFCCVPDATFAYHLRYRLNVSNGPMLRSSPSPPPPLLVLPFHTAPPPSPHTTLSLLPTPLPCVSPPDTAPLLPIPGIPLLPGRPQPLQRLLLVALALFLLLWPCKD